MKRLINMHHIMYIITEEPENTSIKDEVTGTLDQDNDLELPKTSGNNLMY